jgi:hypothetical protein
MPPPTRIHPALLEANKLLLIMSNLKVSNADAVRLWALIEAINPDFAGIGYVPTHATLRPDDARLWAKRRLYFWCLDFAEGCAGVPGHHAHAVGDEVSGQVLVEAEAEDFVPHLADNDGDAGANGPELCVEDFFARLVQLCTLLDRPRQVKFVFLQLQRLNPGVVHRHGDVVHKTQLITLVDVMHGRWGLYYIAAVFFKK